MTYTVAEAANKLGIHKCTLYTYICRPEVQHCLTTKNRRIAIRDLSGLKQILKRFIAKIR